MGTEGTPKKRARARGKTDWGPAFFRALEETHLVSEAAKRVRVHRRTVYKRRALDEEFAQQWAEMEERATADLEQVAVKRATEGSDLLLMFLLKARRPDTYREHHKHEHSGVDGKPIAAEILTVGAKEAADAAHDFLERITGAGA